MKRVQNPDPASEQKVALYGGSFDPVHCAHLAVADAVQAALGVSRVVFIPAAQSPLKRDSVRADDACRLRMLELATEGWAGFQVDDCELARGGTSYSVDTVHAYQGAHPGRDLVWILGADQFEQLPRWHRVSELAEAVEFAVVGRPGYPSRVPDIPGLRHRVVEAPAMPHSSSELRRRIAGGLPLDEWLPPSVEAFIYEHGLYTRRFESKL